MLVVLLFAAAVYALMWALERRRAGGGPGSAPPAGGPLGRSRLGRGARPQARQVAPDDDEDFLRWLDRKRKRDSPD